MVGVGVDGGVGKIADQHVFGESFGDGAIAFSVRRHVVTSVRSVKVFAGDQFTSDELPEWLQKAKAQALFIETFVTTGPK